MSRQQHQSSPDVIFCDESICDGQGELDYIRRQIVRVVMRKDQDKALFTHTRALIKEHNRNRGESAQEFFQKNRDYFCVHLAQQMLENLFSGNRGRLPERLSSTDEPMAKSPRFDLFESWMEKLTKLFGFYYSENANLSISSFIENICDCLVPVFVLCRRRYKEIAESLVDQIGDIVRLDRRSLIYKHWDYIFEHWILMTIQEPTTHDIDVYLFHWIQKNKVEYFKSKTFRSMFRALLFLSLDEQFVFTLIAQIHRCSSTTKIDGNDHHDVKDANGTSVCRAADFSLSTAIRPYFSNILFQFRNAIATEEIEERSKMATKSLEVLISRVDDNLINENAQILLIILKSAVGAVGELCISVWLKFVQKLRTYVFVNLASQVLAFISPLLKFDASKVLFNEIFVVRATELSSSTKENAKIHNILLAMFDNKAYKLDQHLPGKLSHRLSTETAFVVVKSCAELLLTGMVDLYQIVLERLLKVLNGCDLLQIDSSQLARALVFALHRTHNRELRSMIGKCVGTIGLLDLDGRTSSASRRSTASTDDAAASTALMSTAEIVSVDNKVQFTVDFIHDIFSRLDECEQSEMAVKLHSVFCYILLVPLKGHGMVEQIWKKLAPNVVEALNASRQSPFQVNETFKIDDLFTKNVPLVHQQQHLAIIDQSCNFHQWVHCLYFTICDKLEDSLLRTLFASLCCVEFDSSILSRTMCKNIPHMIIQALIEQNEEILDKFEQEALAVFIAVIGGQIFWANNAMVTVCGIVDAMERFFVRRTVAANVGTKARDKDILFERFDALINKVLAKSDPDCLTVVPLSVLAAQKCNYHFRSLRWLEQFAAPKNDNDGPFRHDFYFLLERLYSHLGNSDGVLGTFQVIRNRTVPELMEQILALKVQGNYVDALPLCQQLMGQQNETVKCLLRSNQPLLAQTFIEHTLRCIDQQQQQQNFDVGHHCNDTTNTTDNEGDVADGPNCAGNVAAAAENDAKLVRDGNSEGGKRRRLREYQMEAVCKLGDWDQLAMLQRNLVVVEENKDRNNSNLATQFVDGEKVQNGGGTIEKWGAKMAAIFSDLRQFDLKSFGDGIERARASLVDALERTTLEDSGTIAQAHRNIIKLRSLYEVESVRAVLYLGGDKPTLLRKTIADWERQSDNSLSFAGRSERVLSLRAELLHVIDLPNTALTQCRLLLKCSELARQANYLQRSWTYIAEAKALRRTPAGTMAEQAKETAGTQEDIAIDMEEAKYLFQKGEQFQAINLLEKAVHTNFAELCTELNTIKPLNTVGSSSSTNINTTTMKKLKRIVVHDEDEDEQDEVSIIAHVGQPQQQQHRNTFVEAQMLLADFNERAGAKQMDDLLNTYKRLEQFGQLSESFYYRYATFYDGYCESANEISSQMICTLLRLYRSVLEFSPLYVNHAIPRMLSVWLDLAPKCAIAEALTSGSTATASGTTARQSANKRGGKAAAAAAAAAAQPFDPNREMREAFKRLDKAYFFSSYSQMISRITHSDAATYALLKEMLSDLVVHFPHRCLWLSLSIARSTRVAVRSKRCVEIFDLAKKKARSNNATTIDLNLLIQQYDHLATLLIGIAETQIAQQRLNELSMARFFPNIVDFFENGTMRGGGIGTRGAASRSPLLGKQQQQSSSCSLSTTPTTTTSTRRPQILLPFIDDSMDMHCSSSATASQIRGEVFIHGVDPNFDCLKSLEAPKKMAFIGTDGRTYPLLCKQNDDLCKDARFMDVNRMLNTLFMRDSDTRNQLYIRCYSIIPLKEAGGGIIQWVPNLVPFATALKTVMRKRGPLISPTELQRLLGDQSTGGGRAKAFREQICARHPLAMAQWLRTTFLDACSWYNARLAFTRTAATMSMVGFLLGLGDRHGENMLLDVKTGDLIHVDFNILFDKGEYLKVPEIVPFRLTRNMVDGFGATGVEGTFRKSCEKALKVMRAESRMLRTVLHSFAHDPLLEWTTTEARNQQYRQYGGTALQSQQDTASNTIGMIKMRLAGHIVTARFNPPKACAVPMSVGGQVARLIEIATDEANLAAMYIGWSAFI